MLKGKSQEQQKEQALAIDLLLFFLATAAGGAAKEVWSKKAYIKKNSLLKIYTYILPAGGGGHACSPSSSGRPAGKQIAN